LVGHACEQFAEWGEGGTGVCSTYTLTHVPNTPLDRLKKAIQIGVEVMYSREHTFHLFEPPALVIGFIVSIRRRI
jgi:hypothetical protein